MPLTATLPSSKPVRPRRSSTLLCAHCGAPTAEGEEFCCGGCAFVSRLIRDEGLENFYALKDKVIPPADGYPDGNATPKIEKGTTLVMVVDLLFTAPSQ